MIKRLKSIKYTENFPYFIRYFAVFTLIFFLMTTIIFQIMRSTMYSSTDEKIEQIKNSPELAINFAIARTLSPGSDIIIPKEETAGNQAETGQTNSPQTPANDEAGSLRLGSNYHVLLYDEQGNLINPENFGGLSQVALDKSSMGTIKEKIIPTPFGDDDFRYATIELSEKEAADYASLGIRYAAIYVAVGQIKSSIKSYERTVALVMISFWLISIGASLYLAQVSMRPLLISYQKQKDFVENASHELRTPLTVLQNRLESLFRHPNATILESSESIASSLEEVRNMRILTSNLLHLARRDDELKTVISAVEPSFFTDIFDNFEIIAAENNQEVLIDNRLSETVQTDKVLVKQLLTILFDNAMKYSDDGATIRVEAGIKDKQLYFSVADNGIGISAADKKKIFDRFYRVDKARTRSKGGFGLGLSLAKQISDSLKGSIHVRDNSPKGTIFEVKLPK